MTAATCLALHLARSYLVMRAKAATRAGKDAVAAELRSAAVDVRDYGQEHELRKWTEHHARLAVSHEQARAEAEGLLERIGRLVRGIK